MSKPMPAIPLQQLSDALTDIVVQAAPSVVSIHSARSHSSGFVWRPGLIVTADDALDDEGAITIYLAGGDRAAARLVGRDPTTDVALLRIDRTDSARPLHSATLVHAARSGLDSQKNRSSTLAWLMFCFYSCSRHLSAIQR